MVAIYPFLSSAHQISHQVTAQPSLAHQLSSAQQRTAALAQQRSAVRCRAACFAVPTISYMPGIIRVIIPGTSEISLNHKICNPSLPQPSYSSAAQRSAVRCRAFWCRAFPCGVARCRAALCLFRTNSSTRHLAKCQVPGTGMYVCTRFFVFLRSLDLIFISRFPCFFSPQVTPVYCRSERGIASKHTAQCRAIIYAHVALGIIKSQVAASSFCLLHI